MCAEQIPAAEDAFPRGPLRVHGADPQALAAPHGEGDAVLAQPIGRRGGQYLVRIVILRQLFCRGLFVSVVFALDDLVQLRHGSHLHVLRLQVCQKAGVYVGPVLVGDLYPARQRGAGGGGGEQRQRRREEKEAPAGLGVEGHDLGQNGKRRIVHDHGLRLVSLPPVVAARPKRSDEVRRVEPVLPRDPARYRVIDVFRRVAVVGCFLALELIDEALVFLVLPSLKRQVFVHPLPLLPAFSLSPPPLRRT